MPYTKHRLPVIDPLVDRIKMRFTESLPKEVVLDQIQAMIVQEECYYDYHSFFPDLSLEEIERQTQLNGGWREKICQWSYNVVEHFDLPREVVAISLDLFDRYLATRGNECNCDLALLASLTTLHIAIKIHSEQNIKASTLASLSRGQFQQRHIQQMEWEIMKALKWNLNPPTVFAFLSHFLMLFPNDVRHSVRKEVFEIAIYMAELSVCDSFFVRLTSSTVAMAAIINAMDEIPKSRLSPMQRDAFWANLVSSVRGFHANDIALARDRLKSLYFNSSAFSNPNAECNDVYSNYPGAGTSNTIYKDSVTTSPTSSMDVRVLDSAFFQGYNPSTTEADPFRYSPSPTRKPFNESPMSCSRSQMSCSRSQLDWSPIVARTH